MNDEQEQLRKLLTISTIFTVTTAFSVVAELIGIILYSSGFRLAGSIILIVSSIFLCVSLVVLFDTFKRINKLYE